MDNKISAIDTILILKRYFYDRERAFVNYLSRELTKEQIAKLPMPISFRHFSEKLQQTLKDITIFRSFDEKVYRIGLVVQVRNFDSFRISLKYWNI